MSCKSLLALALVGALVLSLTGSASAQPCPPPVPGSPPPVPGYPPAPEPPRTHTLTIYNGGQVMHRNFVLRHGSWRNCGALENYAVFCRDCPRSPWRYYGTYRSARCAEEVACSLRANGKLALVRHHCG
jgi:hypothetical protein